jgi:nucleoside-diphosphate-sugar epimerase
LGWKICCTHSGIANHLNAMKKILVTGATGFIGNYVIDALLKKGCSIIATSSNESKAAKSVWLKQVQYFAFDLQQFDNGVNYQAFFGNPDAVIHLAWEGLPNYKATFHTEENLPRHFAFIKNLIDNGQQDITITGTCFEYGMQEGCLSEDMPSMPGNAYAIAKDSLRWQLEHLQQQNSFHLKWVRLFYKTQIPYFRS